MAQSLYEQAKAHLVGLQSWVQDNVSDGTRNEATTRLHLINNLLLNCLAWPKEECVAEDRFGNTYADYALGKPYRRMLVEAKKEGIYFELPAGFTKPVCDLSTLVETNADVGRALEQVSQYCQQRGIAVAVVCNGFQLIAFIGSRADGIPPLEGRALVYSSLDDMKERFRELWDNLSRPGLEELTIYHTVAAPSSITPPDKLSQHLRRYPGFKARNQLQTELQILGGMFIEDIVRSPEIEEQFLRECYCTSGALSQYALVSKEILKTRYSLQFQAEAEVKSESVMEKDRVSKSVAADVLAASLSRRPIILLGDVGVGKTVFLRHLIAVEAKDLFERAVVLYVDLGVRPGLEEDIRTFIVDDFARQLLDRYGIDVDEDRFVRGVYHGDLQRFARGIHGQLREVDENLYLREEVQFLSGKTRDRASHLRVSLEHISKGRQYQVVIILDNVDQRSPKFQDEAFLVAQSLAETWPGTVFISLRPETFYRSRIQGSLSAYQPRVFTVSPPRVDEVVHKRLLFARKQLEETGRLNTFPRGMTVRSETLSRYMDALIKSFGSSYRLIVG